MRPGPSAATNPALESVLKASLPDNAQDGVAITWSGNGRAVQLERSAAAGGDYAPVSAITLDPLFLDAGALTNSRSFYRLRSW